MSTDSRIVILDKSFLQAENRDCTRLGLLRDCGCTLVLIDTLLYEICTYRDPRLWLLLQQKLFGFADSIEVWTNNGSLLKWEIEHNLPVPPTVLKSPTEDFRQWFRSGQTYVPDDLVQRSQEHIRQREVESVDALIAMCKRLGEMSPKFWEAIRLRVGRGEDVSDVFRLVVNDDRHIAAMTFLSFGNAEDPEIYLRASDGGLDARWYAFHDVKMRLALSCAFMAKYGPGDSPGKNFVNSKLDADYITLLSYADGLATNESAGDMASMCDWLYGDSKMIFSTRDIDEALPSQDEISRTAYFSWEDRGKGHGGDLDDWFSVESRLRSQIWNRLQGMA